jgi:chromosome partitioning protein
MAQAFRGLVRELPRAIEFQLCDNSAMAATIICFINQKGGCGKSSCCFHLAGALSAAGQRVLLVDADPQGSLSQGFFGPAKVELMPMHDTLAACFVDDGNATCLRQLVRPTEFERLDLVCANQTLAPYNAPCPEHSGLRQFALAGLLSEAAEHELILIDCPPNLYQCSWNALLAADFVVIPVPPEDFGTQGLRVVHQAIDHARQLNPKLQLLGHLVTRYDGRLLVHQTYEQRLRTLYGQAVFSTLIPEAVAFKLSLAQRAPVSLACPDTKAALATRALAEELRERMAQPHLWRQVA